MPTVCKTVSHPKALPEAMGALGFTVHLPNSTGRNSCLSFMAKLRLRAPRKCLVGWLVGGGLGAGQCLAQSWLRRVSMPMTQCPKPSLIPSALRRSEQLGHRAGSRTWWEALAHSRPEDPVPYAPCSWSSSRAFSTSLGPGCPSQLWAGWGLRGWGWC